MPHPTLDHIVYNVLNLASGGRSTNNEHLDPRQVAEWVHAYRAMYIRRDEERHRRLREFEQTLVALPTEEFSAASPLIWRTADPVPELLRLRDNEALTFVGGSDGITSYQIVDNHSVQWRSYSKYTGGDPFVYVLSDGRVYLHGADDATLTIRGLFENPEKVQRRRVEMGTDAEADEWRYPLPMDMVESIVKNIAQTELNLTKTSPLDTKADNLPDEKMAQPTRRG